MKERNARRLMKDWSICQEWRGIRSDVVSHLLPDGAVLWTPFMLNGVLVHSNLKASLKSASSALITMGFISHTRLQGSTLASVLSSSSDGPLEKSSTSVTSKNSVMLSRGKVSAHFTRNVVKDPTARIASIIRTATESHATM